MEISDEFKAFKSYLFGKFLKHSQQLLNKFE